MQTAVSAEDTWRFEWAGSPELRAEFGGEEGTFLAFKRAEHRGVARIYRGRARPGHPGEAWNPLPAGATAADLEQLWRAQFAALPAIRTEFRGDLDAYLKAKAAEHRRQTGAA